jgi:adenine-specific DNA-methyltransferase
VWVVFADQGGVVSVAPKNQKKALDVEAIRHKDKRKNLPTVEHQSVMRAEEKSPVQLAYERRNRDLDPQLVWRGKDEQDWSDLVVQAPPLYIQEKIHPKVLIDDLLRQSKQRAQGEPGAQVDLFADFNGLPDDASRTEFYKHDSNWTNRMILGDSLQVMASLAEREGLRGKVQCIYIDPPYGIKFNSNFQWSTTSRDVKDGNRDHISREPEQVKAFRDTWRDGIHSYLTYLRDRLTLARDLLSDTGSVIVQIGDENNHRVRALMDEVFGEVNHIATVSFQKTGSTDQALIPQTVDYLLVYARDIEKVKYRQLYLERAKGTLSLERYDTLLQSDGSLRALTREEATLNEIPEGAVRVQFTSLSSARPAGQGDLREFSFCGVVYSPGSGTFKSDSQGLRRLSVAGRIRSSGRTLRYLRRIDDFPVIPVNDRWESVQLGTGLTYVVQTSAKVIERCILMCSDPGDLVLDPTCGSGTTAYVSEQWGRRWITIDTSRVALALARARIMGARFPYYLLADSLEGQRKEAGIGRNVLSTAPTHGDIRQGFVYERVPHIMLSSIANNAEIEVIWEKWQETLEPLQAGLNKALPKSWEEWEVPREADGKWSAKAKELHAQWWEARIARQRAIDASIAAKAEFEYLYDKPYEDKSCVRVAGPFTVESLSPHRVLTVDEDDRFVDTVNEKAGDPYRKDGEFDFARMVLDHLKMAGVQQAHKEDRITFTSVAGWPGQYIGAEGRFMEGETERRAGILIGPEYGTVSRPDLVAAAREAGDAGFDVLIACAFNFDAHSSEFNKLGRIPVLKARMNPDLHMADELKNTGAGNLFVVFGEPDIVVTSGEWLVGKSGRIIAHYGTVKELSGLGSLEEINRLGRDDLPRLKRISAGREVRPDKPDTQSGGVGAGKHRRGRGAERDGGVSALSEHGERIAGRSGDLPDSGVSSGVSVEGGPGYAGIGGGGTRPHAGRAQALAAIEALSAGDFPLSLSTGHYAQVTIHGVDVFHPQTGEITSSGPDGIACWFIDTDYNEESFFVRHAYFLGANDPYKALKTTLRAEIDEEAWQSLYSDTSRPFDKPTSGRIAVKVINHLGDEVMKVFGV